MEKGCYCEKKKIRMLPNANKLINLDIEDRSKGVKFYNSCIFNNCFLYRNNIKVFVYNKLIRFFFFKFFFELIISKKKNSVLTYKKFYNKFFLFFSYFIKVFNIVFLSDFYSINYNLINYLFNKTNNLIFYRNIFFLFVYHIYNINYNIFKLLKNNYFKSFKIHIGMLFIAKNMKRRSKKFNFKSFYLFNKNKYFKSYNFIRNIIRASQIKDLLFPKFAKLSFLCKRKKKSNKTLKQVFLFAKNYTRTFNENLNIRFVKKKLKYTFKNYKYFLRKRLKFRKYIFGFRKKFFLKFLLKKKHKISKKPILSLKRKNSFGLKFFFMFFLLFLLVYFFFDLNFFNRKPIINENTIFEKINNDNNVLVVLFNEINLLGFYKKKDIRSDTSIKKENSISLNFIKEKMFVIFSDFDEKLAFFCTSGIVNYLLYCFRKKKTKVLKQKKIGFKYSNFMLKKKMLKYIIKIKRKKKKKYKNHILKKLKYIYKREVKYFREKIRQRIVVKKKMYFKPIQQKKRRSIKYIKKQILIRKQILIKKIKHLKKIKRIKYKRKIKNKKKIKYRKKMYNINKTIMINDKINKIKKKMRRMTRKKYFYIKIIRFKSKKKLHKNKFKNKFIRRIFKKVFYFKLKKNFFFFNNFFGILNTINIYAIDSFYFIVNQFFKFFWLKKLNMLESFSDRFFFLTIIKNSIRKKKYNYFIIANATKNNNFLSFSSNKGIIYKFSSGMLNFKGSDRKTVYVFSFVCMHFINFLKSFVLKTFFKKKKKLSIFFWFFKNNLFLGKSKKKLSNKSKKKINKLKKKIYMNKKKLNIGLTTKYSFLLIFKRFNKILRRKFIKRFRSKLKSFRKKYLFFIINKSMRSFTKCKIKKIRRI